MPRITCITRIWQAKAWFLLTRINHELTINGWRGFLFLAEIAENAERFGQAYYLAEIAEFTINFKLSTTLNYQL